MIICAQIKNEQKYLDEWLNYHLTMGVEHIYLFEDYDSLPHGDLVRSYPSGRVTLKQVANYAIPETGYNRQISLYNWFIKSFYKGKSTWCAFIDIDEYIRFYGGTLDELCSEFDDEQSFTLSFRNFGANGHIKAPVYGIQDSYHIPASTQPNTHNFKSIVKLPCCVEFENVHRLKGTFVDVEGNRHKSNFYPAIWRHAWIDHYYTKSFEDFVQRLRRGNITTGICNFDKFFRYSPELLPQKKKLLKPFVGKEDEFPTIISLTNELYEVEPYENEQEQFKEEIKERIINVSIDWLLIKLGSGSKAKGREFIIEMLLGETGYIPKLRGLNSLRIKENKRIISALKKIKAKNSFAHNKSVNVLMKNSVYRQLWK